MARIGNAIKLVGVPYKQLTVPLLEYSYGVCQEYEVEANVCAGVLKPGVNFVYISKKTTWKSSKPASPYKQENS